MTGPALDPALDPAWTAFAEGLADQLARLDDGDTVVIQYGNRYVQFAQSPDHLLIESSANLLLPPDDQLTPDEEWQLAQMGWERPWGSLISENWTVRLEWPVGATDARAAADRMARALHWIHGVPAPTDLHYRAWNDQSGEQLDWPVLGPLTRDPRR